MSSKRDEQELLATLQSTLKDPWYGSKRDEEIERLTALASKTMSERARHATLLAAARAVSDDYDGMVGGPEMHALQAAIELCEGETTEFVEAAQAQESAVNADHELALALLDLETLNADLEEVTRSLEAARAASRTNAAEREAATEQSGIYRDALLKAKRIADAGVGSKTDIAKRLLQLREALNEALG